ncbi:NlpC/P60 family protein [Nonomuraea rubra]|uniref:Cell wall-associated NlpC family hydrolase n=1 Tax=Nonomuraea rubra TaxID=46180 RepID=A0A7X0U0I7_9ACTN|nr:NlpC/P60 family protein [Nonomuraea rubra]MBB6550651.1 cell wall-associated NlpC family hydrolase [Nonomuraea rubra]
MTVSARLARAAAAAALAMTVPVVVPGAAWADPSPAQVRARLVKLNERADQLVERYNQATEAYREARKKYRALQSELAAKDEQVAELREELAAIAVHNYQFGPSLGWQRLAVGGRPETMLGGMASLDQMARDRAAKIQAYEGATAGLRERRDRARAATEEAERARDDVRGKQEEVDDLVDQQTKLLRRLGDYQSGNPRSTGLKYTGPASGNAREALQFAFAQVGKPYRYGGTGPGSFDCSGLTQAAWRAAGVSLPRTTYTQWAWGADRRVPLDQVQPGDLLFSKGLGHMGMYAGGGKMVHAPQTGDVIKVVDLDDYWRGRLVGAVRP